MSLSINKTISSFLSAEKVSKNRWLLNAIHRLSKSLPAHLKFYTYQQKVTFIESRLENSIQTRYSELFNVVKENFALDLIPDYDSKVNKTFTLTATSSSFRFIKNFSFGDIMSIDMMVMDLTESSFRLVALFRKQKKIYAIGEQHLIYKGINQESYKMPSEMYNVLNIIAVKLKDLEN